MNPNNPFLAYVETLRSATRDAQGIVFNGGLRAGAQGPDVLLFSPHPDDECIIGLLPLRLMRECGCRIINVPVTFGSDSGRRQARLAELRAACGWLGWEVQGGKGSVPRFITCFDFEAPRIGKRVSRSPAH